MKYIYFPRKKPLFNFFHVLFIGLLGVFSLSSVYAQTYATVPFSDGFETGTLGPSWTSYSSLATNGNSIIQTGTLVWTNQTAVSHTGTYFLGMHYPTGGAYNLNQCDLHLNLAGESNLRFGFWWTDWNDETEPEDGIYISDDNGLNFVKVLDLFGASYTDLVYTHFDLNLDSINTVHGLTYSSQYIIRLQQYDNYYFAGGNDGFLFDDISVYEACMTTSTISPIVCNSYTTPSGNQTYTVSGVYTDTLQNAANCDSLITINLTVNSTSSSITEHACGTYMAPDGVMYNSSGIYTAVIPNAASCDSTITINLTVGQSTSSSITINDCDSYTAPDGAVYNSSGTYMATIPNAGGCDSLITIDLTLNNSTTTSINEVTCTDYTAPDGIVYNSSGTYTANLTSSAGCDSIIIIDLVVNTATASTISPTVIDTYTVPSGDETYTISGTYVDTVPNASGCDSIITINLTVAHTGLDELTTSLVKVYPNPTSGSIQIEGIDQLQDISNMEVYDSRGRRVMQLDVNAAVADLSDMEVGTYLLVIRHARGSERISIVKQ